MSESIQPPSSDCVWNATANVSMPGDSSLAGPATSGSQHGSGQSNTNGGGTIDLKANVVRWDAQTPDNVISENLTNRLLFTGGVVCGSLDHYRLDQVEWVEGKPFLRDIVVEKANDSLGTFAIGGLHEFEPERQFGAFAKRAFDQSTHVYLISDANPSLSPGPRVVYVNAAFEQMTGYERGEIIGQTPRILQGEATSADTRSQIRNRLTQWKVIETQLTNYRKNGEPFIVHLSIWPITDPIGWYTYWFSIQRDVTEENRKIEADREQARKAGLAEATTGVLHNVGNIINSVNVSAGVLKRNSDDDISMRLENVSNLVRGIKGSAGLSKDDSAKLSKVVMYLDKVSANLGERNRTVNEEASAISENVALIRSVIQSQQEGAKRPSRKAPVNLSILVRRSVNALRGFLADEDCKIDMTIQQDAHCIVEEHKVIQILTNLIKNGCEASRGMELPTVGVEATKVGERVQIAVIDQGVGMSAEQLSHLFEFGGTTKADGHGFGLHSCLKLANEIQGDLKADSPGLGKGCRFQLSFPLNS